VAEKKRTKGVCPTAFFYSPSHRQSAKHLLFVMCSFFFYFLLT